MCAACVLQVVQRRKDCRLIVTSATLDAETLTHHSASTFGFLLLVLVHVVQHRKPLADFYECHTRRHAVNSSSCINQQLLAVS
jgi:HrpA-like RNA helicase